jgi:hypothetical protein
MEIAEIFAVEGSKNVIALFLLFTNVTERTWIWRKLHEWQDTSWRIGADYAVCSSYSYYGCVRSALQILKNLPISEEREDALLNDFLKDEILVVVAEFDDICLQQIIQSKLPLI